MKDDALPPDYSVVVPGYNEELYLPATLTALKRAMEQAEASGWRGQLIVVDNNSIDNTASVAAQHGAQVVFEPYNHISCTRNCGVRAAPGKYLVFVDADTLISGDLLCTAHQNLA